MLAFEEIGKIARLQRLECRKSRSDYILFRQLASFGWFSFLLFISHRSTEGIEDGQNCSFPNKTKNSVEFKYFDELTNGLSKMNTSLVIL